MLLSFSFPTKKHDSNGTPLVPGIDPIIGQGGESLVAVGLNPQNQSESYTMSQFVISKGGEYFFVPSISALLDVISAL